MAVALQRQLFTDTRASGVSKVINYPQAPLAGATLFAAFAIEDGNDVVSISQGSAVWVKVFEREDQTAPNTRVEFWVAGTVPIGTPAAATINFTNGSSNSVAIIAGEYIGIALPTVDQIITNNGTGATATTGTTAVTTTPDQVAIAAISSNESGATHSAPTNGFAIDSQLDGPVAGTTPSEDQHLSLLTKLLTSTGAQSTGVTIAPVPSRWAAGLATLRAFPPGAQPLKVTTAGVSGGQGALGVHKALSGAAAGVSGGSGTMAVTWALKGTSVGVSGSSALLIVKTSEPANEIEIPAIYVDDVAKDEESGIVVINRHPGPNEIGVPVDSTIMLDVVETAAVLLQSGVTDIDVNGVRAYDSVSGFVNGFTGSVTDLQSPGASVRDGFHFEITPPADFGSLEGVTIRVQSNSTVTGAFDESYSFTAEDLTPPVLLTAVAVEIDVVRLTFDEPVRMLDDGDDADALTASNYTFDALNDSVTPAVNINAVSVDKVSATEVDVTVDIPMTPRVLYQVTVLNVEDIFGNPV